MYRIGKVLFLRQYSKKKKKIALQQLELDMEQQTGSK